MRLRGDCDSYAFIIRSFITLVSLREFLVEGERQLRSRLQDLVNHGILFASLGQILERRPRHVVLKAVAANELWMVGAPFLTLSMRHNKQHTATEMMATKFTWGEIMLMYFLPFSPGLL